MSEYSDLVKRIKYYENLTPTDDAHAEEIDRMLKDLDSYLTNLNNEILLEQEQE